MQNQIYQKNRRCKIKYKIKERVHPVIRGTNEWQDSSAGAARPPPPPPPKRKEKKEKRSLSETLLLLLPSESFVLHVQLTAPLARQIERLRGHVGGRRGGGQGDRGGVGG